MNEINKINNHLENLAASWESAITKNPELKDCTWAEYYRGLKDIDKQDGFIISSAHKQDILTDWLDENRDKYQFVGYSGYCVVTKKI